MADQDRSEAISVGLGSAPATPDELRWLRDVVAREGELRTRTEIVPLSRTGFGRLIGGLAVAPESLVVLRAAMRAHGSR